MDLTEIADEALKQRAWSGILKLSLKHTREPDLLPFLRDVIHLIKLIFDGGDSSYIMLVFNYLMQTGEVHDMDALRHLIHEHLSPEQEGTIMTIAEHFRQEGIKVGMERGMTIAKQFREAGMQQGQAAVLKRLLQLRFGDVPFLYQQRLIDADVDTLLSWSESILDAKTLDEVFE